MDLDAIFKAYDVRGLYPSQLDEEVAHRAGRAFVTLLDARRVLVARDMRSSSEPLSAAFISGAITQGADVVDLGLASTDMLYFASGKLDLPGVVFTASHNPAGYNGMKLVRGGAYPIGSETGMAEIKAWVASNEFPRPPRTGSISRKDMLGEFAEHVLGFVDAQAFKPLKIVVDAANGMAGLTVPAVFAKLPLEVIPLYFELDGTFPNHPADPIQPENLEDLRAKVRETGAVAGLAFDGDADRVFFVDENAEPVSASLLGAMVTQAILERNPNEKVVYSLTCSRVVPEVIVENGAEPIRTRVGHSFIKKIMADTGAIFGTEHSGHYYFREHWRADCGMICALYALEVISRAGGSFSEALAPFKRYWNSGEVNSEVEDKAGKVEAISERFSDGKQDRTDGLTVEYDDWWFNVRASNTEPLLRLNLEHRDASEGRRLTDELLALIRG
ncbi:MAG TPA: phosphomannomutase/phosphoglucomutase [Actinomycetota bacterium]|nr:phosphomannomutase/phosphoglucomutase [Actinomycetota bacterium]